MRAVLKTNDPVELNFAQALLKDVEIQTFVFDTESSIMDGSTGFVPRQNVAYTSPAGASGKRVV